MRLILKRYWKQITLVTLSFLVAWFLLARKQNTPAPTPTPVASQEGFRLVQSFPGSGNIESPLDDLALKYIFNKTLDQTSIQVTVTPDPGHSYFVQNNGKELVVVPQQAWGYTTTYKVTITVKSLTGEELSGITTNFKLVPVTDSPLTE